MTQPPERRWVRMDDDGHMEVVGQPPERVPPAPTAALTADDEAFALDYDPWGERDATYRTLKDRFVVTRKPAECAICFEAVPVGSRIRAKTETDDGQCKTFKFCPECCRLMAFRRDDGAFEQLMARYDLGRRNAEAQRG